MKPLDLPAASDTKAWMEERAQTQLAVVREVADRFRTSPPPDALEALREWNRLETAAGNVLSPVQLLANVHPDLATREACEALEVETMKLLTELGQDQAIYAAFAALSPEGLDPLAARYLDKILVDFRRSGVDKPQEVRDRLKEINKRLTTLDLDFSRITRDDVRTLRVTPDRLGGMPADWVAAHSVEDDGLVTLTTDYPDAVPVRTFATDRSLREEMVTAFLERGWPQSEPVLTEMFALRHELATLVDYPDWPSYDADVKMIGTGSAIPEFIEKIASAAAEPMERDMAVLQARFAADLPEAGPITGVDTAFYQEVVRREQYDVDAQLVRTYFPFAKVRAGLLEVTGRLFGLRWEPVEVPVWHDDVASYDVFVSATDELLGRIHLDLHPRPGKYSHAAQFSLASGVAGTQLPEGVLVCNFPRGLMEHDDVVTLFHEFGHLLHHLLAGHGEWARFSGVATEWDFVEAPSQMLEEWAWDADVLATFTADEAGEPIPAELVEKMKAGEEYGKGIQARQQMFYAAMSYWFHQDVADGSPTDLTERMIELQARYAPTAWLPGTHMFASFGHLGGYSSAYYTYMWSLVIAKDLFSQFDPADLFAPEIAGRYRDLVLARGGEKDAADLVADFLGRPFSFDSYAAWLAR
ncbi:M3 family metallopeptidase [Nocardioides sp. Kera G14]|uniref:M3 family metallopeptidase n=1 Tax=Nocardioides sp. Kera G14 TaxID=2884264 RepID=UPI001D0F9138|nr:M3 family metallopeptidase [Nocardioides sp. Kera G14]UDY23523.1 Zn-dependent oligopeptidase [Nocardioides sp. Kera G14]